MLFSASNQQNQPVSDSEKFLVCFGDIVLPVVLKEKLLRTMKDPESEQETQNESRRIHLGYALADFKGGDCDEDRPVVTVSNCSVHRRKSRRNGSKMKKGLRIEKQATDRTTSPYSRTNAMPQGQRVAGLGTYPAS